MVNIMIITFINNKQNARLLLDLLRTEKSTNYEKQFAVICNAISLECIELINKKTLLACHQFTRSFGSCLNKHTA